MSQPNGNIDFFISYRGTRTDWALWINWVLRSAGFSTIVMDEFKSELTWTDQMREACKKCRRLVPLYSKDYWKSGACTVEFDTYWRQAMADRRTQFLLPLEVEQSKVPDIHQAILTKRLYGLNQADAHAAILEHLKEITPFTAMPIYTEVEPPFPGVASASYEILASLSDAEVRRKLPLGIKLHHTLRGHTGFIGHIAWSSDGRLLASPSEDGTIRLWQAETGLCVSILEGHKARVCSVAFNAGGKMLASGSKDGTIKLWNTANGQLMHTMRSHPGEVCSVAFNPTCDEVASGGDDKIVRLWDASTGHMIRAFAGHNDCVYTVAFHSSGLLLATGGNDQIVNLWEAATGRLIRPYHFEHRHVYSLVFSPMGQLLIGLSDSTIRIVDISSGHMRSIEGHSAQIDCLDISHHGPVLASKSNDHTVRLWHSVHGHELARFHEKKQGGGENQWPGLSFHPHDNLLATVGSDSGAGPDPLSSIIHIYKLDFELLLTTPAKSSISFTSAKIVLVGESNVGKSYLAHRIATGVAPEAGAIKSTHGMKFWPLTPEQLSPLAKAPVGERRDVVLWDMGGQDEYRLIHQLFLHDTTLALILFDPTRGAPAFKEVEAWNKALDNQLQGRTAIKLLVGAKLDRPAATIDQLAVQRLLSECDLAKYYETSALTGRGVAELCEAAAKAIDWDSLGKTSRPELFQAIRDEIENRSRNGVIVVLFDDLDQELHTNEESIIFQLLEHEVAMASAAEEGTRVLNAVCDQLAKQGVIARARTSSGKNALILRVEEVERYAGSLIIAAKNNPRGVPALELRAIAQENFHLPGISSEERLSREQERPVMECTVQLMLEHGICFEHEGLLIFPSLFSPGSEVSNGNLKHSVSLYYDFAGAIDNIYASMVAWLVLAKEFGKVRLWSDRAEFEVKNGGLCGLRKVGRPGGFAHVDVYFEQETPTQQRKEFISFVEDHLSRNGVEIREHVAIKCLCQHTFSEDTLRQRIARGDKDVLCPVCETRHSLTEGASASRARDAKINQHTWALRTRIEKLREKLTQSVVQVLGEAETAKKSTEPIRLLHLSDLHFTSATPVAARLQWLRDDLTQESGLGIKNLDYLIISGDFTDRGNLDGFEKAYDFVSGLTKEFGLSAERCIFVPGNHDLRDLQESYEWRNNATGLLAGEWVPKGDIILARNKEHYPNRLKAFSELFYHKFVQKPYPIECHAQGMAVPFWETGIQFLTLNSCWEIDQFYRKRSGIAPEAVASALKLAQQQESAARQSRQIVESQQVLRIAVWHHAVAGPEQMNDTAFLTNLQKAGVRLCIHGDIHELKRDIVGHWHEHGQQLHILGAGSFGSPPEGRPESTPRLYNVIEINRNLTSMRVHTRQQPKVDGAWSGWYEWPNPADSKSKLSYYDIQF